MASGWIKDVLRLPNLQIPSLKFFIWFGFIFSMWHIFIIFIPFIPVHIIQRKWSIKIDRYTLSKMCTLVSTLLNSLNNFLTHFNSFSKLCLLISKGLSKYVSLYAHTKSAWLKGAFVPSENDSNNLLNSSELQTNQICQTTIWIL